MTPLVKYTSIFQVNGEPILPPLMTMEKRFEMQMYREKAIQLERKIMAERQGKRVQFAEKRMSPELNSSRSGDIDGEDKSSYSENSSSLISTPSKTGNTAICKSNPNRVLVDSGTNTTSNTNINENEIKDRMQKLSKSKTICFDNTTHAVIRALTEEEIAYSSGLLPESDGIYLCDLINNVNLDKSEQTRQKLHLVLQQKSSNAAQKIPSIHINPPTPLSGPSNICEALSASESIDSNDFSGFQSSQATQNQVMEIAEDSMEEFVENSFGTLKSNSDGVARQLNFETESDEQGNVGASFQLRCEGGGHVSEPCCAMRSPKRSVTSPSLKSISDTIGTCSLTTSPRADDTSVTTSLVRSSSFTLDGPSKVLLEHFRKQSRQKTFNINEANDRSKSPVHRLENKARCTPLPSAWRDTVESKAKRAQKKADTKSSARASSNVRSKNKTTFNNYASNAAPTWNSPLPPLKIKRSPYDGKGAPVPNKCHNKTSANSHKHRSTSKTQKPYAVKKSTSSTTYTIKASASCASLPDCNLTTTAHVPDNSQIMTEIDQRHRQKLLMLIAYQQEEQRRLQHVFETQQKSLLEQLHMEKHQQSPGNTDSLTTSLHMEGIGIMSPNQLNFANEIATPVLKGSSPTLSVSNSYMSPLRSGIVSGFTTTPTKTCEMAFNLPSAPFANNIHSNLQKSLQVVDMASPIYANSERVNGLIDDRNGPTMGNRSPEEHEEQPKEYNRIDDYEQRCNAAATIINACARGFLVRRLFQTEQIQRIVQTIRDTLIFVLNLHMETMENEEEANTASNIKLKARLLQQLASASRTLHLIFFQTSIKERMEIISRDRKRIKTKLLSMSLKRSPRIA